MYNQHNHTPFLMKAANYNRFLDQIFTSIFWENMYSPPFWNQSQTWNHGIVLWSENKHHHLQIYTLQ